MKSMTGYGKAAHPVDGFEVNAEIKTVNSRYLDIYIRSNTSVSALEADIRALIKKKMERGKVNLFIDIQHTGDATGSALDVSRLEQITAQLNTIKKIAHIDEPVRLNHFLAFQDLFDLKINFDKHPELRQGILQTVEKAAESCNTMRADEGAHLLQDMKARITTINSLVTGIAKRAPQNVTEEFEKLRKRIQELLDGSQVDEGRLEQELALISDKVDISEECTRLQSHLNQLESTLSSKTASGKRITFILQEILRETNTINSKTTDLEIAGSAIKMKEELEKIREQAQNLE
ncbi:MAG TPA: YicC family protein [Caldithrix abyssi]|uniref:YicC family protein n=1 Tax=Caldithrix abyssi TaxID=187145 RepID=A0A7V1PUA6_CALAY|nr:YicC family protein [Caldithrix abyssi]